MQWKWRILENANAGTRKWMDHTTFDMIVWLCMAWLSAPELGLLLDMKIMILAFPVSGDGKHPIPSGTQPCQMEKSACIHPLGGVVVVQLFWGDVWWSHAYSISVVLHLVCIKGPWKRIGTKQTCESYTDWDKNLLQSGRCSISRRLSSAK